MECIFVFQQVIIRLVLKDIMGVFRKNTVIGNTVKP